MDDKTIIKDCCKNGSNKTIISITPTLRHVVCSKCGYIYNVIEENK